MSSSLPAATDEQKEIVASNAKLIMVQASAGTGKTTTLRHWAESHVPKAAGQKALLIAFNKAVKESAKKVFPSYVQCHTFDSLCWEFLKIGRERDPPEALNVRFLQKWLSQFFQVPGDRADAGPENELEDGEIVEDEAPYGQRQHRSYSTESRRKVFAECMLSVLSTFCSTPNHDENWADITDNEELQSILDEYAGRTGDHYLNQRAVHEQVPVACAVLWGQAKMKSEKWVCFGINRKLAFVRNIGSWLNANYPLYLMVDECQDLDALMLNIVQQYKSGPTLMIGDAHQSIYGFLKCVNAFEKIEGGERFSLTESFRYGQAVADEASRVLRELKSTEVTIKGRADLQSRVYRHEDKLPAVSAQNRRLYLARRNATVFTKALTACRIHPGASVHVLGMKDTWEMVERLKRSFKMNPMAFKKRMDVLGKQKPIPEEYFLMEEVAQNKFPEQIQMLLKRQTKSMDEATLVFSTVHKFKGMEMDNVVVDKEVVDGAVDPDADDEEVNILYVALTRAKLNLVLPNPSRSASLEDTNARPLKKQRGTDLLSL